MSRLIDFRGLEGSNFFDDDRGFQTLLGDLVKDSERDKHFSRLKECGRLVASTWDELAREASRAENLPKIIKFDRAGNPVERVDLGSLTRRLRREVAEFGALAEGQSRLEKFAVVYYLAHNGEASLNCGLSCTDGLIESIEAVGDAFLRETYLPRLRSVDTPLAGAQFVTEQDGGSDVGRIEAEARPNADGTWTITGTKWFCSNPDEYFLVAARPEGARAGTAGVAVFMVPRVLDDGRVNHLSFRRLKDKLGTRSLPTAEIDFNGAIGYQIGEVGDGFKTLMNYVINVSRIHNAVNACGMLHRSFLEARNYARQREVFGGALVNYPMIQEALVGMLEKLWRYRLLTFRLIAMVDEHGLLPDDRGQAMWQRFLINLAKYRTGVTLTDSIKEAILILGGNGIIEDFTVLPRLLRDAMIVETWEGPHNTLCLQIMRDAAKSDLVDRWQREVSASLERWPEEFLTHTRSRFEDVFKQTRELLTEERLSDQVWSSTHARRAVDRLGGLLELAWLAEFAARHADDDATAALMAAAACHNLLPGSDQFDNHALAVLMRHAPDLIQEENVTFSAVML
jgi:alkylation response protein AidB-like acyl-CoA dehydrogenase